MVNRKCVGESLPNTPHAKRISLLVVPSQPKSVNVLRSAQTRRKFSKKNIGSLKGFVALPMDVIYETAIHLDPADLLTLSRLSKDFREVFMSRSAATIWRRVLEQVAGLPPCPPDMTEGEYASLIYDKFCMACGSHRGRIKTLYTLRLRLCSICTKANIATKDKLRLGCVPHSVLDSVPWAEGIEVNGVVGNTYFFRPEVKVALSAFREHQYDTREDSETYFASVPAQKLNAARMVEDGRKITRYLDREAYRLQVETSVALVRCRQERYYKLLYAKVDADG